MHKAPARHFYYISVSLNKQMKKINKGAKKTRGEFGFSYRGKSRHDQNPRGLGALPYIITLQNTIMHCIYAHLIPKQTANHLHFKEMEIGLATTNAPWIRLMLTQHRQYRPHGPYWPTSFRATSTMASAWQLCARQALGPLHGSAFFSYNL